MYCVLPPNKLNCAVQFLILCYFLCQKMKEELGKGDSDKDQEIILKFLKVSLLLLADHAVPILF